MSSVLTNSGSQAAQLISLFTSLLILKPREENHHEESDLLVLNGKRGAFLSPQPVLRPLRISIRAR